MTALLSLILTVLNVDIFIIIIIFLQHAAKFEELRLWFLLDISQASVPNSAESPLTIRPLH